MRDEGLLAKIRASWWLPGYPEALVVSTGGRPLGVLTVRGYEGRDMLRLPANEPFSALSILDSEPMWLEHVTLQRIRGECWRVVGGEESLSLVESFQPVVGPLPACWAVLAVGRAYEAAVLADILRELSAELRSRRP